jgi:hypothetical protein
VSPFAFVFCEPCGFCCGIQETTLGIWWEPVPGATKYILTYRNFPDDWSTAKTVEVGGNVTATTFFDLEQQSTYQAKLVVMIGDKATPASIEASGDTLNSDCTPKSQKKCSIQ